MRVSDGRLLLSPSDVVDAGACAHRLATAFRAAHGVQTPEPPGGPDAVSRAGDAHEAAVTAALTAAGHTVTDLSDLSDLSGRPADLDAWRLLAARTAHELREGRADVVAQGAVLRELAHGIVLVGRPDFLVATPGGWRVEDAKLARSVKPTALLQTMLYRDALAAAGVPVHEHVRLHLGSGATEDVPARTADAWARRQLADVVAALAALPAAGALQPGFVARVEWCSTCDDASPCGRQRAADRHLGGVADLRRDQARRLVAAGITTIDALAASTGPVAGMAPSTLDQLREQAALQVQAEVTGQVPVRVRAHPVSLRATDARPGLWLLPEPDPGDVFFDMEGDPLYASAGGGVSGGAGSSGARAFGLEYLFGATHDGDGFTAFWGHDSTEEGAAFTAFVDWVEARRAASPGLHVYHYAAYERSALTRLAARHATRGDVVDAWLAGGVLVDLYTAVRGGLRAGVPSYSIKKIERLYGVEHTGAVTTAGASIEQYEQYRLTRDDAVRQQIEDYNRQDCDSTRDLRDYLLALRAAALAAGDLGPLVLEPAPQDGVPAPPTPTAELREELAAASDALLDGAPVGVPVDDPVLEARRVLAGLLGYQVREEKAAWQDVFRVAEEVATHGRDAAVEDPKVLGGLELLDATTVPGRGGEKVRWTFAAPAQEHRVEAGGVKACVAGTPVSATVTELEPTAAGLRVGVTVPAAEAAARGWSEHVVPGIDALLPAKVVSAVAQQRSLLDLAATVGTAAVADPAAPRSAARALLLGRARLDGDALPPAEPGEDGVAHAVRLARGASGLVLAVQGPPGAGKSYLGAEVVDALLADAGATGTRVTIGVTANSHAVVQHLLRAIHARTPGAVVRHKHSDHSGAKDSARWTRLCEHPPCAEPVLMTKNAAGWAAGDVLGGTAWAFSPADAPALDWLVVDEAGQMALGDVLAASRGARNVLLLGDPQQLAKPAKAAHPPGVGVSALEHLVRGAATMPPATGIFQDATRRMHADVAGFISDIAYDGRLSAHATCADRAVLPRPGGSDLLSGTGLRYLPVPHEGNAQGSDEECAVVVRIVADLLARQWTCDGVVATIGAADVLVVAPYNAAVARLGAALADAGLGAVRVGTVDRFQGQEAVAVVYSTGSSDAEAAPRGLGFLYDTHRLNVAVSRARCLAFWVGSPALLGPRVSARHQVPLVDAHCRFVERALTVPPQVLLTGS